MEYTPFERFSFTPCVDSEHMALIQGEWRMARHLLGGLGQTEEIGVNGYFLVEKRVDTATIPHLIIFVRNKPGSRFGYSGKEMAEIVGQRFNAKPYFDKEKSDWVLYYNDYLSFVFKGDK